MNRFVGRRPRVVAAAAIVVVVLGVALTVGGFGGARLFPAASTAPSLPAIESEAPLGPLPSGVLPGTGERVGIPDKVVPDRVDLYPSSPSITPGQALELHVSTLGVEYSLTVERLDALAPGGRVLVARLDHRPGHDFRRLATVDPTTHTARANWPVTDRLPSAGWEPGVYEITAMDRPGTLGHALFVVRSPTIDAARPLFAVSALTYQAYNLWGGFNLYTYAAPEATVVSFDRPYLDGDGLGLWQRGDARILAWLQLRHVPLQFTTDADLAGSPPSTAPRLVIFGRHTEYVPAGLRDWVEQHVNVAGDMNLLNFGSNSFYWRARLQQGPAPAAALELACYKDLPDPVTATDPQNASVRWRDAPISRPEGAVLGAQYSGIVDFGSARFDFRVDTDPANLLAGTGWHPGTVLRGLLNGEADEIYAGVGATAVMSGVATGDKGQVILASVTIRTSPAGARVFDAGTFAWADGFEPTAMDLGVATGTFDRFTENVLAWLGG